MTLRAGNNKEKKLKQMARKYLFEDEIHNAIKNQKAIEQWIGFKIDGDDRLINWIRIIKDKNEKIILTHFEMYDIGNLDNNEIYEFPTYEPDEPYGIEKEFLEIELAIQYAERNYNANKDKFVNDGIIYEEYKEFIKNNGIWGK